MNFLVIASAMYLSNLVHVMYASHFGGGWVPEYRINYWFPIATISVLAEI
jgi:hypothetical protein